MKFDPAWERFEQFLADMGDRPEGTSIDRVDGREGYFPWNCRWATPKEQQSHLKTAMVVEYGGEAMTLSSLAAHLGIPAATVAYRIRAGWAETDWGFRGKSRKNPAIYGRLSIPATDKAL